MCGIVGYVGPKPALPVLIEGLRRLEYRGYDSAGVAVLVDHRIEVRKTVGRLSALEKKLDGDKPTGQTGIGHTRWATHGRPSDVNSHPHADCSGRFVVVHNGIIENFRPLKEWLVSEGHIFRSETDTEVVPHLIEHYYTGDLTAAAREAASRLRGSFALVIASTEEPEKLIAIRKDSPLVVGLGEGENFIASDVPAILEHTRRTYVLEDGDVAEVTADEVTVTDLKGEPRKKKPFVVKWDPVQAERGGYEHFMLKEIHEQPKAFRDTLTGRVAMDRKSVKLDGLKLTPEKIRGLKKVFITAAGTAYHAGLVGKNLFERLARLPVEVDLASEYRYRDPILNPEEMMVIVVSQSGETADTLAAMRESQARGVHALAVTNVVGSSVARDADDVIYTWAGPEIAVASTKAYTTQILVLSLLAVHFGQIRGTLTAEQAHAILSELAELPQKAEEILGHEQAIADFAQKCAAWHDVFFIGRGLDYAVSLEGQLKLKEISYIHAEAYAAGELKHGTLALVVEGVPVIALSTQKNLREKMISNIREVKARDAFVLGIAPEGSGAEEMAHHCDQVIPIPETDGLVAPALAVIPLQLLAYYAAIARGCDVDKPRNLAKSVTVE
ncbi:MAG TPA: glutamine--fructose-6-phosphate transaminase (isomerizing) [Bacillota bacterium]